MQEEWKEIEGFSRYKVSNTGRVWDTKNDREVAQVLAGAPQYYYVNINSDDGQRKLKRVHRFVAKAFVEGQSEDYDIVDHIDRDKFNNHYTNLRWTDHCGNQRNTGSSIFVKGQHLKDFVQGYENPDTAYSYISSRIREVGTELAIQEYEEFLTYGLKKKKVVWKDSEVYLTDLSEALGISYEGLRLKVVDGKLSWNSVYNVPEFHPHSFEIKENGVNYWYPNKLYFCNLYRKGDDSLRTGLSNGWSTEEILSSDGLDHLRQTVLGITGTIKELCKHFGISEGCVSTRLTRKGWSLEKALTTPQERIKRWSIDGETKSTKDWCIYYGLDPKSVNKWKSIVPGRTFKDALIHYGVDCEDKEFQPGD